MTPKEKAEELVLKFGSIQEWSPADGGFMSIGKKSGIKCALVAINEIIESYQSVRAYFTDTIDPLTYWQQVKQHIENI